MRVCAEGGGGGWSCGGEYRPLFSSSPRLRVTVEMVNCTLRMKIFTGGEMNHSCDAFVSYPVTKGCSKIDLNSYLLHLKRHCYKS